MWVRAGVILVPRRPPGLAGFSLLVVAGFASRPPPWRFLLGGSSFARVVELGRHTTLKMWRSLGRAGSSPATGTCVLMGLRFGAPVFL